MLGLFILAACLFARSPARWKWPLAAVAFALPWVRLEYVAISLVATAALCLIEWSRRESPSPSPVEGEGESLGTPERGLAHSVPAMNTVAPLLGAVSGILAYFAYNGLVFGGVIPVSGAIQQMWSERLWEQEGGYSFVQNFRLTKRTMWRLNPMVVSLTVSCDTMTQLRVSQVARMSGMT